MASNEQSAQLASLPSSMMGDDFKRIKGIGQKVELRLHTAGIQTYAQLLELSAQELATQLGTKFHIGAERIEKEDWLGQARELAAQSSSSSMNAAALAKQASESEDAPPFDPLEAFNRQHYSTFTIRLSQNADNRVRYVQVAHAESDQRATWPSWNEEKLLNYLYRQAALPAETEPMAQAKPTEQNSTVMTETQHNWLRPAELVEAELQPDSLSAVHPLELNGISLEELFEEPDRKRHV